MRGVLALLLLALSLPLQAAKCRDGSDAPRPDWTRGAVGMPGHYTGVGVAERGDLSLSQQRDIARQSALRDLASSIEVFVRSELRLEESTAGTADAPDSRVDYRAVTEAAASALLADTRVVASWIDPRSCTMWLRMAAPEAAVRAQQKKQAALAAHKLLIEQLAAARDATRSIDSRERSLSRARTLLERIDFAHIRDGSTPAQWRSEIATAAARLDRDRSAEASSSARYAKGQSLLEKAQGHGGAERAQAFLQAREILTGLAAATPFSDGPDFWPEKALSALARFAAEDGQVCEARAWYEQIVDGTHSADWRRRARERARELDCGREQAADAAWRKLVYGRPVRLQCSQHINQSASFWERACQALAEQLRRAGSTRVEIERQAGLPAVRACLDGQCGDGLVVAALADGKLVQRDNPDNPLGTDHQYRGAMAASIVDNGRVAFADRFSGVGGWNPVSGTMAVEVAALQLVRRINHKLAEAWTP